MLGYDQVWVNCAMLVEYLFNVVAFTRCGATEPRTPASRSSIEQTKLQSFLEPQFYALGGGDLLFVYRDGLSGNGDVIAPDEGVLAIGSGGSYALAAARALLKHTTLSAKEIAVESLRIAGEICIYSNQNIVVEEL